MTEDRDRHPKDYERLLSTRRSARRRKERQEKRNLEAPPPSSPKGRVLAELKEAVKKLGIKGHTIEHSYSRGHVPVTFIGKDPNFIPFYSKDGEALTTHLLNKGWKWLDGDRSGAYLRHRRLTVRIV